ncbi:hypothetical protein ACJX0J_019017, partial [Zea mays]
MTGIDIAGEEAARFLQLMFFNIPIQDGKLSQDLSIGIIPVLSSHIVPDNVFSLKCLTASAFSIAEYNTIFFCGQIMLMLCLEGRNISY